MVTIDYLDDERKKLWSRLLEIEKDIAKRTPEIVSEARQHSKKASEYRNRSEEAKDTALKHLGEIETTLNKINSSFDTIEEKKGEIISIHSYSTEKANAVEINYNELLEKKNVLEKQIERLNEIFEDDEDISEKLRLFEEYYSKSNDLSNKISLAHKNIVEKKQEIDNIYHEIIGYTEPGENEGDPDIIVKGLKDELAGTYMDIKAKLDQLYINIEEFKKQNTQQYQDFTKEKDDAHLATIEKWENKFDATNRQIQDLLPQALTAGLSYAYSEKKVAEVEESKQLARSFRNSIIGLICVSVLPFIIGIVELFNNTTFRQVVLDTPRIVLSILPLYIPVLWMAYSANKKRNLSKRLIEEYTHKEVLSKTYEGLSRQISSIEDKVISADLRNKLLYNILEVSSENPGKLISDYQKADHPLMDALEKSVKLGAAVDKLSRLPGFSKIAVKLDKKARHIVEKNTRLANDGIEHMTSKDNENVIDDIKV